MKTRPRSCFQRFAAFQGLAWRLALASLVAAGNAAVMALVGFLELAGMDFGGSEFKTRSRQQTPPATESYALPDPDATPRHTQAGFAA